jgi:predicted NBD/HSP70 family sugar kinase
MEAAEALAQAIAALLAVIDFEAIIIDGAFPAEVRRRLVERTNEHFAHMDRQGLTETVVVEGSVGRDARDRHRRLAIARGVRAITTCSSRSEHGRRQRASRRAHDPTWRTSSWDAPVSRPVRPTGSIKSHAILGGFHHHYARV